MKMLIVVTLIVASVMAKAENLDVSNIIKKSELLTKGGGTREEMEKSKRDLIDEISKLNAKEKRELYETVKKNVKLDDDNPFANLTELRIVGIILGLEKDEQFIMKILLECPPPTVGFQSLEEYIKGLPARVITGVIKQAALERQYQPLSPTNNSTDSEE